MQSGRGKGRRQKAAAQAARGARSNTRASTTPKIEVVDHARDARLLADENAAERIFRELRVRDPKRYVALLKVAEDVLAIQRDPLAAPIPTGFLLFAGRDRDDFD